MTSRTQQVALITGIAGQDGSYLAEYLSAQDMRVVGTTRDVSSATLRLRELGLGAVDIVAWDMRNKDRFAEIVDQYQPNEIYNFAAFSSGEHMDKNPVAVAEINGLAVIKILDTIKQTGMPIRFCQASSSEVFAGTGVSPQSEATARVPRSVYGAAKILADNIVKLYRDQYGVFCCSAFLFNHESPRRGEGFVTKKVVRAATRIRAGLQDQLHLGDLSAQRDWGFAGDYVRAMALMLRADQPDDYVVATGTPHSVAQLCEIAFASVSLDYRKHVVIDPTFVRPAEAAPIVGNAERLRTNLGWSPTISFKQLIEMMINAEERVAQVNY